MDKEEFVKRWSWIDPMLDSNKLTYRLGVERHGEHYAVRGACHKLLPYLTPCHSQYLEHTDGHDWELYRASHRGTVDGVEYLWGMFVEGLGMFNVMVPVELARPLTAAEREAWSKVKLGMYGSHSGKLSYTMPSGVTV
ncbi:hypothetical protein [Ralstonia phage phiRSL1]|uniref:Uncharacterized protein n=1 Tax=Ralstonia phage phiRSL1 TaxID=1980924 RepID=B2ZXS4_9CAUD|nr:hypothetical protein RSL1_ORF059 [Ralstonia phage phiRSL1]BAG41505.1 hypothetical protein [Ralstonia phage phiRSL1]